MPLVTVTIPDEPLEDKPRPEGRYPLIVHAFDEQTSKKGDPMWRAMIRYNDGDPGSMIFHYMTKPNGSQDAETLRRNSRSLCRFLTAFKVPYERANGVIEFNTEDVPGATCDDMPVRLDPAKDGFDESNRINPPRLVE